MRVAETDRHLSVRVAHDDWESLRRIAEECQTTVSAVIREVIEVYLEAERAADRARAT